MFASWANRIIDGANAATTSESCAIDGEITLGICHVSPKTLQPTAAARYPMN
jgi:hypothetical protein